jgi:hypothetical protein
VLTGFRFLCAAGLYEGIFDMPVSTAVIGNEAASVQEPGCCLMTADTRYDLPMWPLLLLAVAIPTTLGAQQRSTGPTLFAAAAQQETASHLDTRPRKLDCTRLGSMKEGSPVFVDSGNGARLGISTEKDIVAPGEPVVVGIWVDNQTDKPVMAGGRRPPYLHFGDVFDASGRMSPPVPDEPGNTPHYRVMPGDLAAEIYKEFLNPSALKDAVDVFEEALKKSVGKNSRVQSLLHLHLVRCNLRMRRLGSAVRHFERTKDAGKENENAFVRDLESEVSKELSGARADFLVTFVLEANYHGPNAVARLQGWLTTGAVAKVSRPI